MNNSLNSIFFQFWELLGNISAFQLILSLSTRVILYIQASCQINVLKKLILLFAMQNIYPETLTDQETLLHSMLAHGPFGTFFGVSQKVFDQVWSNLTNEDGNSALYISMEIGAELDVFNPVKTLLHQNEIVDSNNPLLSSFVKKSDRLLSKLNVAKDDKISILPT